jgi:hypothetical protein
MMMMKKKKKKKKKKTRRLDATSSHLELLCWWPAPITKGEVSTCDGKSWYSELFFKKCREKNVLMWTPRHPEADFGLFTR